MIINREEIIKSFKRWITQTAREQRYTDDEVIDIVHDYIVDFIINYSSY